LLGPLDVTAGELLRAGDRSLIGNSQLRLVVSEMFATMASLERLD
jgi:hypothetical protein